MDRQRKKGDYVLWIACVLIWFLSGCGLPSDLKKEAKQKSQLITSARDVVAKQQTKYTDLKKTNRFDFFKMYASREAWENSFIEAQKMLDQAEKSVTTGRIAFLLKENSKDKAGALKVELLKIDRLIRKSLMVAKRPTVRMADLERIREQAPQLVKAAEKSMAGIDGFIEKLEKEVIPQAQKDYPKRSDEIIKRFAPLKHLQKEMKDTLASAQTQLRLHEKNETADYAMIGAGTDAVNAGFKKMKADDTAYRTAVGQLYQSYTKILEDMKIDHFVTVGRVSWDDNSDYWTEHNSIYPPARVTPKVYDYYSKLSPNKIPATYSTSWGGSYKVYIPKQYWGALNVSPTRNWPSRSDNRAEFWIEDFFPKAYHRYTLVQNGKKSQTDWVLIDEEDYYDYYNFLGMEIVSKPYGFFEDERIAEASPPGMAYVGDGRYGEWRNDTASGRSFWYYYGIYSFLNRGPGFYYYRNDWDQWRNGYRNKKPYFGQAGSMGATYGTFGSHVRTDNRYRNTTFARSGGLRAAAPSVRGAGAGRRGGGPGGAGK